MPNISQKAPLADSLNLLARQKALDTIAQLGKVLPATVTAVNGSVVTVSFPIQSGYSLPNITCAAAVSQWLRPSIQIGDTGIVAPADVALGGITGLGGGTATFAPVAKLSNVVFIPVANQSWAMPDSGKSFVNGPTGFICGDENQVVEIVGDSNDKTIVFKINGAVVVTINSGGIVDAGNLQLGGALQSEAGETYTQPIITNGDVIGNYTSGLVSLVNHTHTQPNDSHGDAEQPTSAPTAGT